MSGHVCSTAVHSEFCTLPHKVDRLREEFGIYMQKDGRLPLVKMNPKNMEKVAKAILSVTA